MESLAEYHADLSHFGSTALKAYGADPLSFYRGYVLGQHRPNDSKALAVGSAFHAAMSGTYDEEIAISPECDRRTTQGKQLWASFLESKGAKIAIEPADQALVHSMVDSVKAHQHAASLSWGDDGRNELSYRWRHESGLFLKVRFDRLLDDGTVIEYKTLDTFGASAMSDFERACRQRRYDLQAALYCEARDRLTLGGGDFYYVVVTKSTPAQCMLVRPKESFLARGREELDRLVSQLGKSLASETLDPGEHNWVLPHFKDVVELA